MSSSEKIQLNRRENAKNLVASSGAKAKLARMLGYSGSNITLLLKGARIFIDEVARNIEQLLGLPYGWMDEPHSIDSIPASALVAIADEYPVERPSAIPVRGRPSLVVRQERESERLAKETPTQGSEITSNVSVSSRVALKEPEVERMPNEVQYNRHRNFRNLTSKPGGADRMAELLARSAGHITFLLNRESTFPDETASKIEKLLKLPKGWMDAANPLFTIPDSAWLAMLPKPKRIRKPRVSEPAQPPSVQIEEMEGVLTRGIHHRTIRRKVKDHPLLSTLQVALLEKMVHNMCVGRLDDSMCLKLLLALGV